MRERHDRGFDEAFTMLFPKAFRLAARILGDRGAAEDVAAEALARAYADWPRVRELPYRDAWILRVASNLAIDTARRKQPPVRPEHTPSFEDAIALNVSLAAALRTLPRRQREVIALRYLAGLSEIEVAQALGVSVTTVKTHVKRGMRVLRERFPRRPLDA